MAWRKGVHEVMSTTVDSISALGTNWHPTWRSRDPDERRVGRVLGSPPHRDPAHEPGRSRLTRLHHGPAGHHGDAVASGPHGGSRPVRGRRPHGVPVGLPVGLPGRGDDEGDVDLVNSASAGVRRGCRRLGSEEDSWGWGGTHDEMVLIHVFQQRAGSRRDDGNGMTSHLGEIDAQR